MIHDDGESSSLRGCLAAAALGLAFAHGGAAQDTPPPAPHASAAHEIPVVPAELLERPVTLRTGIGTTHDPVTTTSLEAQKFYDQGLVYLHNYVWIDAARSFNQALRLDPQLALAYVGLSHAYSELNQRAAADRALERAGSLATGASEHDRRHLAIRERQRAAEDAPGDGSTLAAYRQALDDALAQFPSDVELWLQRGVAESSDPAGRGQGSSASAVRFYERALALVPNHFAAHHYLTHACENAGRLEPALEHFWASRDGVVTGSCVVPMPVRSVIERSSSSAGTTGIWWTAES